MGTVLPGEDRWPRADYPDVPLPVPMPAAAGAAAIAAVAGFAAGRRGRQGPAAAPGRDRLRDQLAAGLARAERAGTMVAVLVVDLDRFKAINDSLGPSIGDQLLAEILPRLQAASTPQDLVVHLQGDEFAVVREGIAGPWEALESARRLASAWAQPFLIGGEEVFLTACTGIAAARPGRADPDTLVREAAAAVSRAKERGRGQVELYDEAMRERAYERLRLETDLRRAVEQNLIDVAFQPIIDLEHGRPVGVEALARWTHPERGPVSPSTFVAVAEQSGLVEQLGRQVLAAACTQAARWRAELPGGDNLTVAVNVSARQVAEGGLPGDVRDALRAARLPPEALTLEVTESALMEEVDAPGPVLATLRSMGVRVVLDDFGTGHSSLGYLRRFPLDGIKLDRAFVDGLAHPDAAAVVDAIIRMGASLGLALTAEGVETREQVEHLRALRCRYAQGYLLARPMPAADAGRFLSGRLSGALEC